MTEDDNNNNNTGPSKGELKKMAKKAQKAALKQQPKDNSVAGDAAPSVVVEPTPPPQGSTTIDATTSSSLSSSSYWKIAAPSAKSLSTIKVVWCSMECNVPLRVDSSNNNGSASSSTSIRNDHTKISGTGGNAMMAAIYGSSSSKQPRSWMGSCFVDEWCEWERTILRPNTTVSSLSAAILQPLEQAVSISNYVVAGGSSLSMADICIVTTLFQYLHTKNDNDYSVIPSTAIQRYLRAHETSYRAAVAQAEQLETEYSTAMSISSTTSTTPATTTTNIDLNEPSLLTVVDTVFRSIIQSVFGLASTDLPKHIVKVCSNPKHGDYQVSAAMPIFAALKSSSSTSASLYPSPTHVASALIAAVGSNHAVVTDLVTQGPGFVICKLQSSYLQHHMNQYLYTHQTKLSMPTNTTSQICVVDFSSPNIAKEMHVGHLRSTIIGEAVCRILEAAGHTVHRMNHVGDWGTQFGMLIQYLKDEYPDVVGNSNSDDKSELPNITDLTAFYKNAKQRFDDNPDFKKLSQTNVVKLQSGDAECLKIWKMLCDVSRNEFQKVYNRLDVTNEEYGESYYNDKIPGVIEEFIAANKIQIEEGGAKCVFVDKYKVPLMLQKSDGGYGYDSTDMAALKHRLQHLRADRIIVITDFSQGDHFKMIYQAGHDIGWVDRGQQLQHIGFGTVQGEDGKRFKTRSGDTVRLVDLLDEAVHRMEAELKLRIDDGKANITVDELHEVAEAIGYGAVKYYDLRRNPTSNYKFSYDQMLDTKGDTAVYLLYARVRLESIIAKAASAEYNVHVDDLLASQTPIEIVHESERSLALQLQQFTDTMEQTLEDLYPFHICEYVYKLATAASDFVTQCRVLGSPEMSSRILLCYATTSAMRQCFDLLGIRHVKRI